MASCPSYSALTSRHGSMIHTGNSNGDDVQLEHGLEGGSYVPEFDPPSYDASFHVPASEGRQEEREVLPSYRRKELLPPAWSPLKVKKRRAPASTILARSSSPPSSMPPFLASSKSSLRHSSWYLNQSAMVAACQADAEREVAEALRQKKFKRLGHGGSTRLILGAAELGGKTSRVEPMANNCSAAKKIMPISMIRGQERCMCRSCKSPARPQCVLWPPSKMRSHQRAITRCTTHPELHRQSQHESSWMADVSMDYGGGLEVDNNAQDDEQDADGEMLIEEDLVRPSDDSITSGSVTVRCLTSPPLPPLPSMPCPSSTSETSILLTADPEAAYPPSPSSPLSPIPVPNNELCPHRPPPACQTLLPGDTPSIPATNAPSPPAQPHFPTAMEIEDEEELESPFDINSLEQDEGMAIADLGIHNPLRECTSGPLRSSEVPLESYLRVHVNPGIRALCLLVLHLHARYQLLHLACAFLASMVYAIFEFFRVLSPSTAFTLTTAPPRSLNTMYRRLRLWDRFEVKTICPKCWEFERFDEAQPDLDLLEEMGLPDAAEATNQAEEWQRYCSRCRSALYEPSPRFGAPRALRQAPYDLLSRQLADFLGQPGFEDACESYHDTPSVPGVYTRLQDESVWKELKAPDGSPFFPTSREEARRQAELRLGLLVAMDWFNPNDSATSESHSTGPLSVCIANLPPELSWQPHGFPLRDGLLHKRRAAQWYWLQQNGKSKLASKYFTRYGVRWSEFCGLRYFDPIKQGALDPMHLFLPGMMKTVWYNNWVLGGKEKNKVLRGATEAGTRRELDEIHDVLATIGYPAGGSLTSDEWRALGVLYGPAAIPPVLLKTADPVHPSAARNYLKLATAIKIYLRREITESDLVSHSVQIYGEANVTPTFHWITHMAEQIRCFGPVHGFWTFLFERLNKVLKGYETNGHKGGEAELTFAREFKRETGLSRLNTILAGQSQDPLARLLAVELQRRSRDIARIGMLAAMTAEAQDEAAAQSRPASRGSCILSDTPPHADLYVDFKELEVDFWQYARYRQLADVGPDAIIPAHDICGTVARCTMEVGGRKMWITMGLSKLVWFVW
ncbi:hypothetical protein DACRYDRAFT_16285 [Dacryopinax primogenitus]|uniref:Uncharacterized protein n=1 Tax=Dacryopinax primogenitus (strain DJM 731) TaxID=1858805 RepID=M5G780_DACPD|nr:uncharacterized protein DACRYDRAFT_16285 [Dacryopinax primogenitus]EJU01672.1 hypothetical protein DACRYDRAFT_16285 [Dacryopinax primogenitus]